MDFRKADVSGLFCLDRYLMIFLEPFFLLQMSDPMPSLHLFTLPVLGIEQLPGLCQLDQVFVSNLRECRKYEIFSCLKPQVSKFTAPSYPHTGRMTEATPRSVGFQK